MTDSQELMLADAAEQENYTSFIFRQNHKYARYVSPVSNLYHDMFIIVESNYADNASLFSDYKTNIPVGF